MGRGPFTAAQLREEGRYELSDGHPIHSAPGGGRHGASNALGTLPLASDPAVAEVGVDVGYSPSDEAVRAPDIAVGNVPAEPGWVRGAPPLAVEYADRGQDEEELTRKIEELLAAGTRYLWVVRLSGPRRVEVHRPGEPVEIVQGDGELLAPGVLELGVPVAALYEPAAALRVTLRNLLKRLGIESLEAYRDAALAQGRRQELLRAIEDFCGLLSIELTSERRAALAAAELAELDQLRDALLRQRRWPGSWGR